jgi:hypothetical protein
MSTPEQRAQDAQTRREKLEAKAPQLIEIVKKGQHFLLFNQNGVQEIYIWCELNPPRLYWEPSANSTTNNQQQSSPNSHDTTLRTIVIIVLVVT